MCSHVVTFPYELHILTTAAPLVSLRKPPYDHETRRYVISWINLLLPVA